MSRLINDDELKKSIHEKTLFSKWQKVLIETVIDDQPTVDAVPVTRCKDCEWYNPVNDCYGNCTREGYDEQWYMVYATDFCSMPKRKEHETNRR